MPAFKRIVYDVYGTLNAAGDNCVVVPTYYQGNAASYARVIGEGKALDPARWFIVVPNMLGNGVSASPSNEPGYAQASVRENVAAQREMLAALGVRRVALVYGWSMGAMQAFAWALMYPDMVASILPVCGTARCWPLNHVFIEGVKAALLGGKRAFGRAYAGWAYSAAFYREELWRGMGYASCEDFLRFWEDDHEAWDARDLAAMLWTWQHGDVGFDELARITARAIIMPCKQDMYFVIEEALAEAAMVPGAEVRVIDSPYGHCAGAPGLYPAESAMVEAAMRELLDG